MDRDLTDILDSCLADIRAGRCTLAECLEEYPEHRADLEALLPVMLAISPPPVRIDPRRKLVARARFIEAIHEDPPVPWWRQFLSALGPGYGALRFGLASALAILLTATLVVTAALASQDAKPGDLLYPVRTVIEDVQVAAAGPPEARARLRVAIASQRLNEVEQALSKDDEATARRAAAGYEEALARAKAELEQAKVNPDAVPDLGQALQNNLRRQEIATARARERGDAGTAETLERAKERYIPQMQPWTVDTDRVASTAITPTPAVAQLPSPTAEATPAGAVGESTSTGPETMAAPTAETFVVSPTPRAPEATPTPGSLRGVVGPGGDIAQRPADEPTSTGPAPRPVTPSPAIGLPGIPAPEPPPIVLGPAVPPRTGPTPPSAHDDDSSRGAPSRAAPEPTPAAIAADSRAVSVPRQTAGAPDAQRPADVRPTPSRSDDNDDVGHTPSVALNPRSPLPPFVPPGTFGGPGGGAPSGQYVPAAPPAGPTVGAAASPAPAPSGPASAAPAAAPSFSAPAASAAASAAGSAAPAAAAMVPQPTVTPTRTPTATPVPPLPTPTNAIPPVINGNKPPDDPSPGHTGNAITGQGSGGLVSSPPGSGGGTSGTGTGTGSQPSSVATR